MPGRRLRFNAAAEAELEAAADWYEQRRPGLGARFVTAVDVTIAAVLEAPRRHRQVAGTGRALTPRFPYVIVYRELSAEEIEIVAVAHVKRRPGYWSDRTTSR